MNPKVSIKQIILSYLTALVCGVIFAVIVPILALFVLDIFVTSSLFDPLHQGKNIEAVWSPFIAIIIIQIIFLILSSVATGIAISYLTELVKTGWIYLIGMGISIVIYFIF